MNRAFAKAVVEELDRAPDAAVFFHDYHLYVAPGLVRAARPEALLAHFVHIPWPQSDYWHVLPAPLRQAIHEGLLANDVVGFHTARWRRNFEECAVALAGPSGRATHSSMRAAPCAPRATRSRSTSPEFDALSRSEPVLERERALEAGRPELLVLRVDRTDPSKNIVRGFRAFALLLERHPELHGRVGMLALLDPSRQDVPAYAAYLAAIEEEAAAVNERFGRDGWQPVDLRVADDFPLSVAGYKQYDVLLVNAVYDGLNLIAKEGPLVNERDGVLVLSENTGAYEELGEWALGINPFDIAGQADALYEALVMPAARARSPRRGDHRARARARRRGVDAGAARRPRRGRDNLSAVSELSHVDASGSVQMVDVGAKPAVRRRAVAKAVVRLLPDTATKLRNLPKGDALATAQLAGIMAAKRTSELIPLCHPLPLTHVEVVLEVVGSTVEIVASAETTAQTGVEMEALTAASVAALTVYDMAKAVDKQMTFEVSLLEKVKE